MKRNVVQLCTLFCLMLSGCTALQIDSAVSRYQSTSSLVGIGDTKERVLGALMPTQEGLPATARKPPESYKQGENIVEIYYFRSGRQPDGLTTDDEFTPYVFTNGILTAIGWAALGGPKSHGQVIQPAPHIEQKVIVQ